MTLRYWFQSTKMLVLSTVEVREKKKRNRIIIEMHHKTTSKGVQLLRELYLTASSRARSRQF
jgi:hypothetical protein